MAMRVGTNAVTYLASDTLGSVSEALDGAGTVPAVQLYAPYGGLRYSSGTMPTAKGFTGQRADAATGLDYYGARYYDAVAGQFTSADTVASGLSPYAYVKGNPETLTDPTGHRYACPTGDCGGGGDGNPPPPPATSPGSGKGKGDGGSSGKGSGSGTTSSQTCLPVDVGCLLVTLNWSKVDWLDVMGGVGEYLTGAMFLMGGITALALLLSNPGAFLATASATVLFGGSPVTALLGVLTTISFGLSLMVHGVAKVMSSLGIMTGALATVVSIVEDIVDATSMLLATVTMATTVAGAFAGIGALVGGFMSMGASFGALYTAFQSITNVRDMKDCHPDQNCPIN